MRSADGERKRRRCGLGGAASERVGREMGPCDRGGAGLGRRAERYQHPARKRCGTVDTVLDGAGDAIGAGGSGGGGVAGR